MIINKNDAILVILCFKMLDGGTVVQRWLLEDGDGDWIFLCLSLCLCLCFLCVFVSLCLKMLDGGTVVQ